MAGAISRLSSGPPTALRSDWFDTLATQELPVGLRLRRWHLHQLQRALAARRDFASNDPSVVFTMFFGSYFGDWDSQNNFLRAAFATTNYTLTSAWAGRPYWLFPPYGVGGDHRLQHAPDPEQFLGLLSRRQSSRSVHIALMGDPTLRMHVVAPPSVLVLATNRAGGVDLSWNASPDTVLGYHVYRGPTVAGPFTRLTTNSGHRNQLH